MKFRRIDGLWTRISWWVAIGAIGVASLSAQTALSPTKNGSIQGTVVGSDGTSLPGAHVFAALKANVGKIKAPPTFVTNVVGAATASSGNTFIISNLPEGSYILCADTTTPGWLDPCHWSTSVPAINLAQGQSLTGQTVVMTKGAVVQIRINDPWQLLSAPGGTIVHDVEVVALGSNNAYFNARITSTDPGGRNEQVTLPFSLTHTLIVRSPKFALTDSTGAALPMAGRSQPLQIAPTAAVPSFTYTVASKLQ